MQIPSADRFRPEHDPRNPRLPVRFFAPVPGAGYDLHVPEGADGEPDAASLAFAGAVLSALDAIVDEAVQHVRGYADAERLGIARGRPDLHGVFCDAAYQRVEVGLSWQAQMYILWTVAFRWNGSGRRSPDELSVRSR